MALGSPSLSRLLIHPNVVLVGTLLLSVILIEFGICQSIDYFDTREENRRQQQQVGAGSGTPAQQQLQRQQIQPLSGPQPGQQQPPSASNQFSFGQHQQQPGQPGPAAMVSNPNPYGGRERYGQRNQNSTINWGGTFGGGKNSSANSEQMGHLDGGGGNVQIEVQLHSYANSGFRLTSGRLCTCPAGNERCLQASPQRNGYNCLTSLTVFVLSADDQMHFDQTSFSPLNAAGQLGQKEFGPKGTLQFQLDTEPSAIGVIVHNLGPQITLDGNLYETNTVTVVDTFIQTVKNGGGGLSSSSSAVGGLFPSFGSGGGGQQQNAQLQGQILGTQLSFGFSVSCRGARSPDGRSPLVGLGCDLSCNSSAANPTSAICKNSRTGFFSLCRWINGNSQVTDCNNCPWGIKEDAYCADELGGVLEPNHAGVVSSFYYSAFIVLCIFSGLLLFCLIIGCLIACLNNLRGHRSDATPRRSQQLRAAIAAVGGSTTTSSAHRGDPERVALTSAVRPMAADDSGGFTAFRLGPAEDSKPPPPYSIRSNGSEASAGGRGGAVPAAPNPVPRSNASTASAASGGGRATPVGAATVGERRFPPPLALKAPKAPSPPRFQPLPHIGPPSVAQLGGGDSLNSSFAGLPAPSVSADV